MKHKRWLIIDTVLLGIVGALSAQLFLLLLRGAHTLFLVWISGYHLPELPTEGGMLKQVIGTHGLWLIPVATTLGGLISGILVFSLAPESEGDGADAAVRVFHRAGGYVRPIVAPLKTLTSAITIGSGGAAGREGPIALIAGGFGSVYATFLKRSDEDRRLLMIIGVAAGLSAIFRSPIGTAIFAIEVLYADMEFEAAALFYALVASVVAYSVNGLFVGWQPLFIVPQNLGVPHFFDYCWYIVLGAGSGLVATILPVIYYKTRDLFHKLPVWPHLRPAIGGLLVGLMAIELPQVLGGGYGWIQEAIDGRLTLIILLALIFAKILALSFTVASGGSGGSFGPTLFIGAMVGGAMAKFFGLPPAAYVVVGMAAVFGGSARVPVATILMVTEMTGGYELLVPAALAVLLSYAIQVTLSAHMKYRSLYESQVGGRADSPAHHVEHLRIAMDLLDKRRVTPTSVIGHLDLLALLESGVALNLSQGKRLTIGRLRESSPWAGKTIKTSQDELSNEMELVAIIRGKEMLLPHPETILQAGDKVLAITTAKGEQRLQSHLDPLCKEDCPTDLPGDSKGSAPKKA